MAKAHTYGMGWHGESKRHSIARKHHKHHVKTHANLKSGHAFAKSAKKETKHTFNYFKKPIKSTYKTYTKKSTYKKSRK